tara:strand:- start:3466 stop:4671 length:1206 start_codon:yes stop_codon:yes gene_type:complete
VKILHIVGGSKKGGAFKGAYILHKTLQTLNIDSQIINDEIIKGEILKNNIDTSICTINNTFVKQILSKLFIFIEKLMKTIVLPSKRSTFTFGLIGFDLSKLKEIKKADIIHIHWLKDGFINFKTISKIKKPVVWTMRDMWPFTGGSHYTIDFENYENGKFSQRIKNLKKKYFEKINFVAISAWLKGKAENSYVLNNYKILQINNNIDLKNFNEIDQDKAKSILKINTNKKIILFGANNPQSIRKGWKIFLETLKKLNKEKYFLLIFGNFWSSTEIEKIGIEFKSLGFLEDKTILNAAYSSSDFFVATSLQEAFGKTWVESVACNRPVICFKNTGISENIKHKINGFIVDNISSSDLKNAIDWVSNNFNYSNKNKMRETIQIFDSKNIAKEYLRLYKKILDK